MIVIFLSCLGNEWFSRMLLSLGIIWNGMLVFLYRVIMCCMLIVFSEGMVIISSLVVVLWIMVGVLFNVLRIGRFCSLVFCRWGVLLSSLIGWKLLDWCRLWIRVLVVCFVFRISIWCVLVFDCSVW